MNTEIADKSVAPAALPVARLIAWSVKRELWENRALIIAPLSVAGVILLGFVLSIPHHFRFAEFAAAVEKGVHELEKPYDIIAIIIIVTGLVTTAFYCLDALYAERRDRSILFWKSLPVSDFHAVLAKACVPMLVFPVVVFVVALATQFVVLLLSTAVLAANSISPAPLWTLIPWFSGSIVLIYGLIVIVLWYAPLFAWLLLVSAWAKRTPFLWLILPPLMVMIVEKIAFGTRQFAEMLGYRFNGSFHLAFDSNTEFGIDKLAQLDPLRFLSTPGLWIGLAFAAAFLYAAVRLRRYREPI